MRDSKSGHFQSDGADVYIPIGFIPDVVMLIRMATTNPLFYWWFHQMQTDEASGKQEGVIDTAGVKTYASDSQGITAYDTGAQLPTVAEWSEAVSTAATARTATARGTLVKATKTAVDQDGLKVDRSAIFECTTAGTSSGTEPTWNTNPDGITMDSDVAFQLVTDEALGRIGYKGIGVAAEIQTDDQEFYFLALLCQTVEDYGDVVGWTDGVKGG